eukprot:6383918-Amphidinium_carterae.1
MRIAPDAVFLPGLAPSRSTMGVASAFLASCSDWENRLKSCEVSDKFLDCWWGDRNTSSGLSAAYCCLHYLALFLHSTLSHTVAQGVAIFMVMTAWRGWDGWEWMMSGFCIKTLWKIFMGWRKTRKGKGELVGGNTNNALVNKHTLYFHCIYRVRANYTEAGQAVTT